jgi:nucleotidyltransferase/DNA polymerase involved in DNA repair
VGQKTASTLDEHGARTIGEVAALGPERLEALFGTHGLRIYALATGADDPPVRAARHPQSLSRESTLAGEPFDREALNEQLQQLARQLEAELRTQPCGAARDAQIRYQDQATTPWALTAPAAAPRVTPWRCTC